MHKNATEQPERFKRAVRAACCDACNWPECGCETTADVARRAINAWDAPLPDEEKCATAEHCPTEA